MNQTAVVYVYDLYAAAQPMGGLWGPGPTEMMLKFDPYMHNRTQRHMQRFIAHPCTMKCAKAGVKQCPV